MNEEFIYVFKALSHRSRLHLIDLLSKNEELSVTELTDEMPREASTVSRHLNELKMHGIVKVRQDAQSRYYSLDGERIQDVFENFLGKIGVEASN